MKNKRGISPLIAWVLLVSFAIAMALLVTKWVVDNVKDIEFTDDQAYCDDASITLTNVCITSEGVNTGQINISMKNNGDFRIDRLSIGRETDKKPEEWCLKLNVDNFNPGTEFIYFLKIGKMTGSLIGDDTTMYQDCDDVSENIIEPEGVTKIAIVPWIKIGDKSLACVNKKIEINKNTPGFDECRQP